ncbi:butyrophilin-like protein 10 isoform X1 [Bufo gargarizans]|uniref:butyrophilin-like protein 10 isoform X1 n=1 Tax=Bufo gargarizans TaxID=30331 RepID=UPI001CF185C0|nr:butyrophilin-like protein 10 isoform X1 [Bufo gargarizans]
MMALFCVLLTLTLFSYLAVCDYVIPKPQYEEIVVPRFGNATLPCQFSFIEGTYDLGFSWHREDIIEEIEVEDLYAYIQQTYEYKEPQLVYSFHKDKEDFEEQDYNYHGRVRVDTSEVSEGDLTLHLTNVDYPDEALYTCKAISPHGKGETKLKLMIQEEEEPPVKMETIDNVTVAHCVSAGWYKVPIVRWLNRREEDISENSTMVVLEEMQNGSHRVSSTLTGVKSHEIYRCLIRDVKKARRTRTVYRRLRGAQGIWRVLNPLLNLTDTENPEE